MLPSSGNTDRTSLHLVATKIRDDLLDAGLDQVEIEHPLAYTSAITVHPNALQRYAIDIASVARAMQQAINDGAGGNLTTAQGNILLRTQALHLDTVAYADIPIIQLPQGQMLTLGDIATITYQVPILRYVSA